MLKSGECEEVVCCVECDELEVEVGCGMYVVCEKQAAARERIKTHKLLSVVSHMRLFTFAGNSAGVKLHK